MEKPMLYLLVDRAFCLVYSCALEPKPLSREWQITLSLPLP